MSARGAPTSAVMGGDFRARVGRRPAAAQATRKTYGRNAAKIDKTRLATSTIFGVPWRLANLRFKRPVQSLHPPEVIYLQLAATAVSALSDCPRRGKVDLQRRMQAASAGPAGRAQLTIRIPRPAGWRFDYRLRQGCAPVTMFPREASDRWEGAHEAPPAPGSQSAVASPHRGCRRSGSTVSYPGNRWVLVPYGVGGSAGIDAVRPGKGRGSARDGRL